MKYLGNPQSGSQANTVASRNRYGQYLRTRAMPVNPRTKTQTTVRTNLGSVASQWPQLTAANRDSWDHCAAIYPIKDSLGQTVILSGFQQFVRSNAARVRIGLTVLAAPPNDTPFSKVQVSFLATTVATPNMPLTVLLPTAGQELILDFSRQVSNGVKFWDDWRFVIRLNSTNQPPVDAFPVWQPIFGDLVVGRKIFMRARILNECGVYGPETIVSTQVTGPAVPPGVLTASARRSRGAKAEG